jgi:hypothetical protein
MRRAIATGAAVLLVALAAAQSNAGERATVTPAAPLAADLTIPDTMSAPPGALDIDPKVKPVLEATAPSLPPDDMCSLVNVQRIDMGRGLPQAAPKACRKKGLPHTGQADFGVTRPIGAVPLDDRAGAGRSGPGK